MNNIDKVIILVAAVGFIWMTYKTFNYLSEFKLFLIQIITGMKEIKGSRSILDNKIHDVLRMRENSDAMVKYLLQQKDDISEMEKELSNREDYNERCEIEFESKKDKYETDLSNCKSKNVKLEKRAKDAEARLADLLRKDFM